MRADIFCGAALWLLALECASLAEAPRLRPSRDVAIVYRTAGPRGRELEQRVRWWAASQTMRIDTPNADLHVIVDYPAQRMSVIDDAHRSVVEIAAPDNASVIAGQAAASYTRLGSGSVVAGYSCTEWRAVDRQGRPAQVCITEHGVLLRAGTPGTVRVSAISKKYVPQDVAAFRIPDDYARLAPGASQ